MSPRQLRPQSQVKPMMGIIEYSKSWWRKGSVRQENAMVVFGPNIF